MRTKDFEATDEMIDAACAAVPDLYRVDAMRAIEAALAAEQAQVRRFGWQVRDAQTAGDAAHEYSDAWLSSRGAQAGATLAAVHQALSPAAGDAAMPVVAYETNYGSVYCNADYLIRYRAQGVSVCEALIRKSDAQAALSAKDALIDELESLSVRRIPLNASPGHVLYAKSVTDVKAALCAAWERVVELEANLARLRTAALTARERHAAHRRAGRDALCRRKPTASQR